MLNREPIFAALFAKLPGLVTDIVPGPFVTKSRRLKHWNDVPGPEQPALFQVGKAQTPEIHLAQGAATKWALPAELYLYTYDGTEQEAGTTLNLILDQIEAALAPPVIDDRQTLGGLVEHCWISAIETDEGALGAQAMAIVSIEMTVDA